MTDVERGIAEYSSPRRSGCAWLLKGVGIPALTVAAVSVTTLSGFARPAAGDAVSDARAKAAQIETQLNAAQNQMSALSQVYDAAQYHLQQINTNITSTKSALAADRSRVAKDRATLSHAAVANYISDGTASAQNPIFASNNRMLGASGQYNQIAEGNLNLAVHKLQTAQNTLSVQEATLQNEQSDAQQQIQSAHNAVTLNAAAVQQQQNALSQEQGQIAQLVQQQQQQEAAAAAAATAAKIAAAQQAASPQAAAQQAPAQQSAASSSATPPTSQTSGGGGESTSTGPSTAAGPSTTTGTTSTTSPPAPSSGGGGGGGAPSASAPAPAPAPPPPSAPAPAPAPAPPPPSAPAPAPVMEAPPPPPPSSSGGEGAVQAAESQLGVPYVWGGETPGVGFDCSGLTAWAWGQVGVSLPHYSGAQMADSTPVSISDLQPGDLLFYGPGGSDHVAMYVGGGTMIEAPHTGAVVWLTPLRLGSDFVGAGRP